MKKELGKQFLDHTHPRSYVQGCEFCLAILVFLSKIISTRLLHRRKVKGVMTKIIFFQNYCVKLCQIIKKVPFIKQETFIMNKNYYTKFYGFKKILYR